MGGCKCGPVWSSPHPEKAVRSPQCWWYLIAAWHGSQQLEITANQSHIEVEVEVNLSGTEIRPTVMGQNSQLVRSDGGDGLVNRELIWSRVIVSAQIKLECEVVVRSGTDPGSQVMDQQRGPVWSSPRPLKHIYCSSNLQYLHLGTSGLANYVVCVRSRSLHQLSSSEGVLREPGAKKRLVLDEDGLPAC